MNLIDPYVYIYGKLFKHHGPGYRRKLQEIAQQKLTSRQINCSLTITRTHMHFNPLRDMKDKFYNENL